MARLEIPRGPRRRHHFLRDAILALVFAATAASCASHRDVAYYIEFFKILITTNHSQKSKGCNHMFNIQFHSFYLFH